MLPFTVLPAEPFSQNHGYANHIHASTLFSVLFADDTESLAKGHNLKDLSVYVNEELRKIANWFKPTKWP
jgi:hypothetical protein